MIAFLFTAVGISLSGVLAPGPITAATLAIGTRSRHAGLAVALGHIAVELPAVVLLVVWLGGYMELPAVRATIGIAGGAFLIVMGVQLLLQARDPQSESAGMEQRHPFVTGALLTATSPYFWIWAATVGLTLTGEAATIGLLALVLFALVHWLCDLSWLEVLSQAGYRGSKAFGPKSQQTIAAVCGVALLGFGLKFFYDAGVAICG